MKIWEIMDIVELSDDKMGIRKCRSRENLFDGVCHMHFQKKI